MASLGRLTTSLLFLTFLGLGYSQTVFSPPDIQTPDRAYTKYVTAEDTHTEECSATGNPQPTYWWMRNGKRIDVEVGGKVQIDATTGKLTIEQFKSYQDDGEYMCIASNRFPSTPGQMDNTASSFSAVITLKQTRMNIYFEDDKDVTGTEYSYFSIPCDYKGTLVGPDIVTSWFLGDENKQLSNMDNDRLYVDAEGTLHFTYLLRKDRSIGEETKYRCGIGSTFARTIKLGSGNYLAVTPVNNPSPQAPKLEYTNSGKKAKLFTKAVLECFFSGYDPEAVGSKAPRVKWESKNRRPIEEGNKYEISKDTRRLTIKNVQENDEGDYYCKAETAKGEETQWTPVELDVISDPIWLPSGAPADQTVPEGVDAVFDCNSRSMDGETPPASPIWYINGKKTGPHNDPNRIQKTNGKKRLIVKSVSKPKDILCIQCQVQNQVGTTWGDACLNVILPIRVTQSPPEKQEIVKGDGIYLAVVAESDPIASNLNYEYTFKNKTYEFPHATLDHKFYINTSDLTTEEYRDVAGLYKIEIANPYQKKIVTTEVVLVDPLPPIAPRTSSAGFPMWIIGLIAGIVFLLIILLIIICVICRKKQEGDYNVDKKEHGAGLDPKQELMDKGFDAYSRPNPDDYEYGDKPRRELPYDEDDPMMGQDTKSLGEYSDGEEALFFNEDGSFIGQYHKKDPTRPANEPQISYT